MEVIETPRDIAEIVENTMREFNSAMQRREALIVRISNHTNQIIRFSMIGLTLLGIAVVTVILILLSDMSSITQRIDNVANYMEKINTNIIVVADNLTKLKQSVELVNISIENLDEHVKVMPLMNKSIVQMTDEMLKINNNIHLINTHFVSLNGKINLMSIDMAKMSHQVIGLNNQLGLMGRNVGRMASPIKMLPFP